MRKRCSRRGGVRICWLTATHSLDGLVAGQTGEEPRRGDDDRVEPLVLDVGPLRPEPGREAVALELAAKATRDGVRVQLQQGCGVRPGCVDAVGGEEERPVGCSSFAESPVRELADRT